MSRKSWFRRLILAVGVVMMLVSTAIVFLSEDAQPVIAELPANAIKSADQMMSCISNGDFYSASQYILGGPDFGTIPKNANPAAEMLWDAFLASIEYRVSDSLYLDQNDLALDVEIYALNIGRTLENLDSRANSILMERVATAADTVLLYDENNNYRQELIDSVFAEAVQEALHQNPQYDNYTVTLHFEQDSGEWWIRPDTGLEAIFSAAFRTE